MRGKKTASAAGVVLAVALLAGCGDSGVPVPDVTGMRLDEAQALLEEQGFEEVVAEDAFKGGAIWREQTWAVVDQEPVKEKVDLDDEIVLMDVVEQLLAEQVTADYGIAVTASCDADGRRVLVDGTQTPLPCTVTNVDDPADSLAVVASVQPDGSVEYAEA